MDHPKATSLAQAVQIVSTHGFEEVVEDPSADLGKGYVADDSMAYEVQTDSRRVQSERTSAHYQHYQKAKAAKGGPARPKPLVAAQDRLPGQGCYILPEEYEWEPVTAQGREGLRCVIERTHRKQPKTIAYLFTLAGPHRYLLELVAKMQTPRGPWQGVVYRQVWSDKEAAQYHAIRRGLQIYTEPGFLEAYHTGQVQLGSDPAET